jgi:excisionase family DNA binding protein
MIFSIYGKNAVFSEIFQIWDIRHEAAFCCMIKPVATKKRIKKGFLTMEDKLRLLTIGEAAKLIDGLTEYSIRRLCRSGELPCFKTGKKYLIDEKALIAHVMRR